MVAAACDALIGAGARQILFKYCSTFDCTDEGNIGPVAQALMERLGVAFTVACPAFPANGRSVYQGHLFVGQTLLSDSPMKDHPLTPMRDSNLVRVLQRQTTTPVGLVPFQTVEKGAAAVRAAFAALAKDGPAIGVADAITDDHLRVLGEAFAEEKLLTGGSGIALGLPANFRKAGPAGAGLGRRSLCRSGRPRRRSGGKLLGRDPRPGEGGDGGRASRPSSSIPSPSPRAA